MGSPQGKDRSKDLSIDRSEYIMDLKEIEWEG